MYNTPINRYIHLYTHLRTCRQVYTRALLPMMYVYSITTMSRDRCNQYNDGN